MLEYDDVPDETSVCDMTAIADVVNSFFNISFTYQHNELVKEQREKSLQAAKEKRRLQQNAINSSKGRSPLNSG